MGERDDDHDQQLALQARAGDRGALEALIVRLEPRLRGLALRLTGDAERTDDLVQDAILRGLGALDRYRADAPPFAWLAPILVNRWRDQRGGRAAGALPAELPDRAPGPVDGLARDEAAARVEAALARLSPMQRATLLLRAHEGLSYREIATVLGCSLESVKVHLHAARQRMGESLA